jgi:hypothetical protein
MFVEIFCSGQNFCSDSSENESDTGSEGTSTSSSSSDDNGDGDNDDSDKDESISIDLSDSDDGNERVESSDLESASHSVDQPVPIAVCTKPMTQLFFSFISK